MRRTHIRPPPDRQPTGPVSGGPALARLERHANALVFDPSHPAWTFGDIAGDQKIEFAGNAHRARDLKLGAGVRNVADDAIDGTAFQGTLSRRGPVILQISELLGFWLPVCV